MTKIDLSEWTHNLLIQKVITILPFDIFNSIMKKNISLFIIIATLFFGCFTNKPTTTNNSEYYKFSDTLKKINIAEFEHIKDFELPIRNSKYNSVTYAQIVETDTAGLILIVSFYLNDEIFFYDIEKEKLLKTVRLKGKEIESFYYVNKDSIFVFTSPHQNIYYHHDSSLVMINEKSEILKSYSWKDAPVWCTEKPRDYEDSVSFSFLYSQKLAYSKQKIMMPFVRFDSKMFGDSIYFDSRPITGYFETHEDQFYPTKIKYPALNGKFYYPYTFHGNFPSVAHDNEFNIGFIYTPEFYHFNSKTNEIKKHTLKSSMLDSIYPFSNIEQASNYGKVPRYWRMYYDSWTNKYFKTITFYNIYRRNTFIVADTNYNFEAEGILPKGVSKLVFTKNYILAPNSIKTNKLKNKVVFSAYKLKYRKGTNQELIRTLKSDIDKIKKEQVVTNFFRKEIKLKEKNYSATILIWENCYGTVDFVIKHYKINRKKYEENNVNLVLVGNNEIQIKESLKQDYNLNTDSISNIWVVGYSQYMPYLKYNPFFPRVVSVRNNKVVFDTIFGDDKIDKEFQIKLLKLSDEQKILK